MHKDLYGLLESAPYFYKKLKKDLEAVGFKVSPYDPYVANMIVRGKQQTVVWHFENLKCTRVDTFATTELASYLGGVYGGNITVHCGKVHDYLGVECDYSKKGPVIVSMIKNFKKVIMGFPEAVSGSSATPAVDHLFQVRDPSKVKALPEHKAQAFHHTVAQLIFLSTRARQDVQTPVAFLTTRVN